MNKNKHYFWQYFKKYYLLIFFGFLFLISAKIAYTIEPIFFKKIIEGITTNVGIAALLTILAYLIIVKLIEILSEYLRDYILAPVIMGVSKDFEKAVFNHLLQLPVSYHADSKTGAAARAVTRGSQAISFILDFSMTQFLPPIFELVFVTVLLLSLYTWQYSIITLLTVIFYALFTIWGTEKRVVFREAANNNDDETGGILVDSLTNIDTVKYFHNEKLQFDLFSKIKQLWFHNSIGDNRIFAAVYGGQGLILLIGYSLILTLATWQAVNKIITVGDLVLLTSYVVRLTAPITTLGFIYGRFKSSFVDIANMEKILGEKIEIKEPENPVRISKPRGDLKFEHVDFNYSNRAAIIKDLNLEIKPGQRVAFVGPSGAGKSTITKLIFRLYDVSSGKILLDDIDIRKLKSTERGKLLATVPQDPALFNDTIANNIKFGKPNATQKEVEQASKSAQIYDFIMSLPEGFNTLVGERGIKISGGERQRVAIARAIIKNPRILIFDEATSSLDSTNEQKVLETIDLVAKGRTSISIAHRLSTIVNSDVIYVLKKGKIVESGTHRKLLEQKGEYAKLWKIQIHKHD